MSSAQDLAAVGFEDALALVADYESIVDALVAEPVYLSHLIAKMGAVALLRRGFRRVDGGES